MQDTASTNATASIAPLAQAAQSPFTVAQVQANLRLFIETLSAPRPDRFFVKRVCAEILARGITI